MFLGLFPGGYTKPEDSSHWQMNIVWQLWQQVPNQDDPRLYPICSQFSISVSLNLCSESVGA